VPPFSAGTVVVDGGGVTGPLSPLGQPATKPRATSIEQIAKNFFIVIKGWLGKNDYRVFDIRKHRRYYDKGIFTRYKGLAWRTQITSINPRWLSLVFPGKKDIMGVFLRTISMRRYINQLKENEKISETYMLSEKQLRPNKKGNLYLQFNLSDKTGTICGYRWDVTDAAACDFESGNYVRVEGVTQRFQGTLQCIAKSITKVDAGSVDPADFVRYCQKHYKS